MNDEVRNNILKKIRKLLDLKEGAEKIGSKKGACSCNTQPAKGGCLYHDRRDASYDKVPAYVNRSLSATNAIVFEDPMVSNYKTLTPLVRKAEKLYTGKTGQKCQKSFTPFRESVLVINESTTPEQLMEFKELAERRTGWKCIGIYMHNDEGYTHSKFIEGDTDFHINHHAHVLWHCQNPDTGKSIPCTLAKLQGMQDDLAAATGMERGNKSNRRHLDVLAQRNAALEQRCQLLEQQLQQLQAQVAAASQAVTAKEEAVATIRAAGTAARDLISGKNRKGKKSYK